MLMQMECRPLDLGRMAIAAGEEAIEEMLVAMKPLAGQRVLHLGVRPFGTAAGEIMRGLVPLMRAGGLDAQWQILRGSGGFAAVGRRLVESLQGSYTEWHVSDTETWLGVNRQNAELFEGECDYVVVHDPEAAPFLGALTERLGRRPAGLWFWRCHIDLTDAQPETWDRLWEQVKLYDGVIMTARSFIPENVRDIPITFIAPAISPISSKNDEMSAQSAEMILRRHGIDPDRPLLVQVSRLGPWNDPLGVVDIYREVRRLEPAVQLAYITSLAPDDPASLFHYERLLRRVGDDPDVVTLTNLEGVGNVEVNAFQRRATVVLHKSTRPGFGFAVAEALWNGRAVVSSDLGGIALQIQQGETGLVAHSPVDFVKATLTLLQDGQLRERLGTAGRELIRAKFLMPRYARDYARLFSSRNAAEEPEPKAAPRDHAPSQP